MAYGQKNKPPILFHKELVGMGPVEVTINSEPRKAKDSYVVDITVNGTARGYWCENTRCTGILAGLQGQTVGIQAHGKRDEAMIEIMHERAPSAPQGRSGHAAPPPYAPPAAAPAPSHSFTPGARVGMALNNACANLTARGEALDPLAVTQMASDLLRIAEWLEAGNLMPKTVARADNVPM